MAGPPHAVRRDPAIQPLEIKCWIAGSSPARGEFCNLAVHVALTAAALRLISVASVGRAAAARKCRGKSGLHGDTVPDNVRRGFAASGKVPQKTYRLGFRGKGEKVRQERTALPATAAAGQTPPGAKPNRDGAGEIPVLSLDQPSGLAARGAAQAASQRNGCHAALLRKRRHTEPGLQAG